MERIRDRRILAGSEKADYEVTAGGAGSFGDVRGRTAGKQRPAGALGGRDRRQV
jgi:hypothetical protein